MRSSIRRQQPLAPPAAVRDPVNEVTDAAMTCQGPCKRQNAALGHSQVEKMQGRTISSNVPIRYTSVSTSSSGILHLRDVTVHRVIPKHCARKRCRESVADSAVYVHRRSCQAWPGVAAPLAARHLPDLHAPPAQLQSLHHGMRRLIVEEPPHFARHWRAVQVRWDGREGRRGQLLLHVRGGWDPDFAVVVSAIDRYSGT